MSEPKIKIKPRLNLKNTHRQVSLYEINLKIVFRIS